MNYVRKYKKEKATVCADKTCVTVYGDAARLITGVAVCAVFIIAFAYVARALR